MHTQPIEVSLAIGAGCALVFLGALAWWRNKRAVGNALFAYMSFSVAVWTLTDWILSLAPSSQTLVLLWKILFYAAVFFGPAIIMHATRHLAQNSIKRENYLAYFASVLAFACSTLALTAGPLLNWTSFPTYFFLQTAAGIGLVMYVVALLCVAFHLYPQTMSTSATYMDKRRATYGIIILTLFSMLGMLQLTVGSVPIGMVMPFVAALFLLLSLMAFVRTAFLDVELSPLQAFVVFLIAYGVLMLLRAEDQKEAWVIFLGSAMVGVFAFIAIRTVRGERTKRLFLEDANRQLRMIEEAKSDFLDMVAHQLRGPLGAIRAASNMLAGGDYGAVPDKAAKTADQIQNTATRLLSLSDTFLNASRLEVGAYRSQRIPTDIRKEIDDIFRELSVLAEVKKLSLVSKVSADCAVTMNLDREVLENVLFNLVDNAIKYTVQGSITVSCRRENNFLIMDVTDTGPGMSSDECHDLFKKFHRGKVGRMHQTDGTGLGLYIVKQLIEAAGGSITVACEGPNQGTTFSARLPYDEVKSE